MQKIGVQGQGRRQKTNESQAPARGDMGSLSSELAQEALRNDGIRTIRDSVEA
jgi:hypothetical protein